MIYFVIGVSVVLILCVIYARLHISFNIVYEKHIKTATIYISFYRMRLYKKTMDFSKHSERELWEHLVETLPDTQPFKHLLSEVQSLLKKTRNVTSLIKRLINNSNCIKLTWQTTIGTGDASTSAVLASSLWVIKGIFLGGVSNQCMLMCQPFIAVSPTYQQRSMSTYFNCILSLKVGQTIYIVLKEIKNR